MAGKAIKLSEELVEIAREESTVMRRSVSAQVEYWARLGREVEAAGALGPARVRELLGGKGSVQDLDEADDALYLDALTRKLEALDGSDTRLLDALRAAGYSIASVDEQGRVVVEKRGSDRPERRNSAA